MPELAALSLFSGIGGMDLAAEAAGFNVAAMCEIDGYCRSVLRKHWPNVPIYEDIRDLTGEVIEHGTGLPRKAIGLIFGGFPCQ
jgi:DNA (cytosine-5)-methyltransferase 1